MLKKYLGLPISTRYNGNSIIIEYDDRFQRTNLNTLESNIVYTCFLKVCEIHNIEDDFNPLFSSLMYKCKYTEKVTVEVFNKFNARFFESMDEKLEKMLELVFEAMDLPIAKIRRFGRCDSRMFDVLKYFMDFEEIPNIEAFYKYGVFKFDNFIVTEYRNIADTEKYQITDLSIAKIKKYANLKNKYILKLNGSIVKRFVNYDDAFNYLKNEIQLVKTLA